MHALKRHISFLLLVATAFSCVATRLCAQTADGLASVSAVDTLDKDKPVKDAPTARISLLTCTPGEDLYTKFGHTAIRVKSADGLYDWVFNYGCFDYRAENFVLKFVLGQTDYMLGAEPTIFFLDRYSRMGTGVCEQVLNLTHAEAVNLAALLEENVKPENQQYRYNWLYDNCTERARDMIEKAIEGMVDYARVTNDSVTVRQILHDCLRNNPWMDFGINLLLGSEIDLPADESVQMFIPDIFREELDCANVIRVSTGQQNLVKEKVELLKPALKGDDGGLLTPNVVFGALLVITVLVTWRDLKRRRQTVWFDVALYSAQGLVGCLIAFLFCFSQHPSVDSNWLVMVFNPIPLAYAGWMLYCHKHKKRNMISVANVIVLTAFLPTMLICIQKFSVATYIVVLTLAIRAIAQMELARKKRLVLE